MKLRADRDKPIAHSTPATSAQGFGLTLAAFGTLLVVTLCGQLPAGFAPSWLRAVRGTYRMIWPQAWSFYANTADTSTITAYRLNSNGAATGSMLPLSTSEQNAWGLGRTTQADVDEALFLADQVPANYWSSCSEPLSDSCLSTARTYRFGSAYQSALLCGRIVFVRAQPSSEPAERSAADRRPVSVAVVQLTCSERG
jgi:hypothetical protein